jgi:hypothetical protein
MHDTVYTHLLLYVINDYTLYKIAGHLIHIVSGHLWYTRALTYDRQFM